MLLYSVGQHSWLFTEPNTCVEISFTDTSGKTNRTFVQSSLSRKYEVLSSGLTRTNKALLFVPFVESNARGTTGGEKIRLINLRHPMSSVWRSGIIEQFNYKLGK